MTPLPMQARLDEHETPGGDGADIRRGSAPLLICLPPASSDAVERMAQAVAVAFPAGQIAIAGADGTVAEGAGVSTVPYTSPRSQLGWVLTANDYQAAASTLDGHNFGGVLLVGTETVAEQPQTLLEMADALWRGTDLALPRFQVGPHDGLVNAALLYPLTRALYGAEVRFPLPLDAALSVRMLQRMNALAARQGTESLVWPVSEAAMAGFGIAEIPGGFRSLPQPNETDLNKLLGGVTSSLFSDIEAKASFWQRGRVANRPGVAQAPSSPQSSSAQPTDEVAEIVNGFRNAYTNLLEIWTLVLPPQTLLALKKLSLTAPSSFTFQPELWARIVYDFALAFHLRTLNRGHLLGALTPIYLAWVASYVRSSGDDSGAAERQVQAVAEAFEREKPYLVARWRWPDRFNP